MLFGLVSMPGVVSLPSSDSAYPHPRRLCTLGWGCGYHAHIAQRVIGTITPHPRLVVVCRYCHCMLPSTLVPIDHKYMYVSTSYLVLLCLLVYNHSWYQYIRLGTKSLSRGFDVRSVCWALPVAESFNEHFLDAPLVCRGYGANSKTVAGVIWADYANHLKGWPHCLHKSFACEIWTVWEREEGACCGASVNHVI